MNANVTLLITCCAVFLAQLGMSIYLPALPQIARGLHTESAQLSWGMPLYLIGMALPMLFWGTLAQRIGRKPVLLAALSIYGVANLALAGGATLESFLLMRLIQGVGASGISVMARVLIRDSFRGELLAKTLSWISISFVIALGVGQYVGSVIEALLGWQAIFCLLGAASLLMTLIISKIRFPALIAEKHGMSSWIVYRRIFTHRAFLLPAMAGGFGYGVIIAFNTGAPVILQGSFNWSSVEYGLLGWPISVAYFLGALVVNRFVLHTGRRGLMTVGVLLVFAGSSAMLLSSHFASGVAGLVWLPFCIAVFGQSLNYPISLSEANDGAPIAGAYAMALSGFIHQLMAAVIGVLASLIASPEAGPLSLLCVLLAFGAMLCVRYTPMRHDS